MAPGLFHDLIESDGAEPGHLEVQQAMVDAAADQFIAGAAELGGGAVKQVPFLLRKDQTFDDVTFHVLWCPAVTPERVKKYSISIPNSPAIRSIVVTLGLTAPLSKSL